MSPERVTFQPDTSFVVAFRVDVAITGVPGVIVEKLLVVIENVSDVLTVTLNTTAVAYACDANKSVQNMSVVAINDISKD